MEVLSATMVAAIAMMPLIRDERPWQFAMAIEYSNGNSRDFSEELERVNQNRAGSADT